MPIMTTRDVCYVYTLSASESFALDDEIDDALLSVRRKFLLKLRLSLSVAETRAAILMAILAFLISANLHYGHSFLRRDRSVLMFMTPCIRRPHPQFERAFDAAILAIITPSRKHRADASQNVRGRDQTALCCTVIPNTHGHRFQVRLTVCFPKLF